MATTSNNSLVDDLRLHRLLDFPQLEELNGLQARFADPKALAKELIQRGWLTPYQANQLLNGKGQELALGAYILLERLGEGGMGQVFKARHRNLNRICAIKLIRKERLENPNALRRFHREVRSAAALSHPNIVRAYDADEIAGNHLLVMEYIDGAIDLAKLVKTKGPLLVPQACEYIRQTALGLQHAHERGMVHRDIKPANLLLTDSGTVVKVLDMGVARLDEPVADDDKSSMTQEGSLIGTPDYIAPEQALDSHAVDIRADLYALGCSLYFLLTGRVPFPGGTFIQKIYKHQFEEPQPVESLRPEVAPEIARVQRKMMAKKPEDRYQTPADVAAALAAAAGESSGFTPPTIENETTIADGHLPEAPKEAGTDTLAAAFSYIEKRSDTIAFEPPPLATPIPPKPKRRPWLLAGAIGSSLVVGLAVVLFLIFKRPAETNLPPKEKDVPVVVNPAPKKDEAWSKLVAAMSPDNQVKAVADKLKEVNLGFDGIVKHYVEDNVVTELTVITDKVADISPVRALTGLRSLACLGTSNKGQLADLAPLKDLQLTSLKCSFNPVSDLAPLQGMPLTTLWCAGTKVSDLKPLKGMKLTELICHDTRVADLTPLKGMKLLKLDVHGTLVSNLTPLKDMKLTELICNSTKVADLTPLKDMKLLKLHIHGTQVSTLSPLKNMKLTELLFNGLKVSDLAPLKDMQFTKLDLQGTQVSNLAPLKDMKLTELNCRNTHVADLAPLKDMKLTKLYCEATQVFNLTPLKNMKLLEVTFSGAPVADLTPLKDMKLTKLDLRGTQVSDLTPLKNMKLTELNCEGTKVSDLAPLENMKLSKLYCGRTEVADLAPLRSMKLTELVCHDTKVSDLAPLKDMKLTKLDIGGTPVFDLAPLSGMRLTELICHGTEVPDLAALKGMKLTKLNCAHTPVADLAPLKGMKLTGLYCDNTKIADVSPLAAMHLQEISFTPGNIARGGDILRRMNSLKTIGVRTEPPQRWPAVEFWRKYDAGDFNPKYVTQAIGMKFAWVPPGEFMMGSPKEEIGREAKEIHHHVTLTRGFYMGVYAVTQEEWQAVMGDNPSEFKGAKNLPVEKVSWNDCQEFIKKFRELDKKPYRLPTEAEWEYACRAGTVTPFHFGATISTAQANFNGASYGKGKPGVHRAKTTPVGAFPANLFGLHDMHGNVWQWCQDWHGEYPQKIVVNPQGPKDRLLRVLRGGSWSNPPASCRSASRYGQAPDNRDYRNGFRICFFPE